MCQPNTKPIPQAAKKAPPPPEETAQTIVTNEDLEDSLGMKKKKRGTQALQIHDTGKSPLTVRNNLNVP